MSDRKIFVLNDEFIAQLQNLISYSILTGTNIVDNIRQLRLEESSEKANSLVMTKEYLEYYEKTVEKMKEDLAKEMEKQMLVSANESDEN